MKLIRCSLVLLWALVAVMPLSAQSSESYRGMLTSRVHADKLPPPQHLQDYVKDEKLTLGLRDAILLALENNSNVQIEETQIEAQKFTLLGQFSIFDPSLQSSLTVSRYSSPTYSQLQGVGVTGDTTLNSLSQTGQIAYTQTFTTGTNIAATISSNKFSTNSSYNYFNPYFNSTLNLTFTQPLLRGAGHFANTALIKIARRALEESRSTFEAEVNDAVLQVINQYWLAV
jgi:outer membrane protein TolC